tara:strand:+ start:514 stop:1899 length:1386 start_codon:yes stop_codon:yes gene_type:complete
MSIKKNNLIIFFIIFLFSTFVIEVLYLLPSPTGDDLWFLKLSFNICREDLFISSIGPPGGLRTDPQFDWVKHGWLMQYLMAKFNIFCSLRGIFIFNYILKIGTSILFYQILKKKEKNLFILFIIILFIYLVQLKLQFRPEPFAIFIYCLLIFFYQSQKYFLTGVLFAALSYSQPIMTGFTGLFILIYNFKDINGAIYSSLQLDKFFILIFGSVSTLIFLTYIYPFSFLDYIIGLESNSGTYRAGFPRSIFLKYLSEYYIFTKFMPLWGIFFLSLYIYLVSRNYWILLSLPFIYFFGPNVPTCNYELIGITPLLILFSYEKSKYEITKLLKLKKKYIFYFLTLVIFLGYGQYFSRNVLTIFQHKNEIYTTQKFLDENLSKVNNLAGFAFTLNKDTMLNYTKNKMSITPEMKKGLLYDLYSVNGNRNPCPDKLINSYDPSIYILGKKIFNTNSGYGIYICKLY